MDFSEFWCVWCLFLLSDWLLGCCLGIPVFDVLVIWAVPGSGCGVWGCYTSEI